eukprot:m.121399 g.121399  ORF g.121399 m.121399 type:complete len:92 (+) comp28852_c0_seq1:171-446(+)
MKDSEMIAMVVVFGLYGLMIVLAVIGKLHEKRSKSASRPNDDDIRSPIIKHDPPPVAEIPAFKVVRGKSHDPSNAMLRANSYENALNSIGT